MSQLWCVRANDGEFTREFLEGGYIGIGWELPDLTEVHSREQIAELHEERFPRDSAHRRGNAVASIETFLLRIQPWDFVITPASNRQRLHYGIVAANPSYFFLEDGDDSCPYPHRRRVIWSPRRINRADLPELFQSTMRGRRTAFSVGHRDAFLREIGLVGLIRWPALRVVAAAHFQNG